MENNNEDILEKEDNQEIEESELSPFPDAETNDLDTAVEQEEDDAALTKLQGELTEQKEKYMRLFAEFDNFKRRNARERIDLIQTAGKEVITSLLETLDDADRAEKQMQETADADQIKKGVNLVFAKLRKTLKSKGLQQMESVGTDFDVEKHEAITEIPVPNEKQKGKVVDEIEKGYYLNDKLIRFAKVVVGK